MATDSRDSTMTYFSLALKRCSLALGLCTGLVAGGALAQSSPSWLAKGPAGGSLTGVLADPANSSVLYLGSEDNGVFVSSDSGGSWAQANTNLPLDSASARRHIYALASLGSNAIYAVTDSGLFVSAAGGSPSWQAVSLPSASAQCGGNFGSFRLATTASQLLVGCGDSALYATTGTGTNPSWTALPTLPEAVQSLGVIGGQVAVGAPSGKLYLPDSNPVSAWIDSEQNLASPNPRILPGDPIVGLAAASDAGSSWSFVCTASGRVFEADASTPASGAWSWTEISYKGQLPSGCNSLNLARVSSAPNWVLTLGADNAAYVSDPFAPAGASATQLYVSSDSSFVSLPIVRAAVQTSPASLSPLLWATGNGLFASSASSLATLAPAVSALTAPNTLPAPRQRLHNVNVNDFVQAGSVLYALVQDTAGLGYSDVWKSSDDGLSWSSAGQGLPSGVVLRQLVADGNGVPYLATSGGVYVYQSGVWSSWPAGQTYAARVRTLAVGASTLYVGLNAADGVLPNTAGLVLMPLVGGANFGLVTPVNTGMPGDFDVRALVVQGGKVWAGGGSAITSGPNAGLFDNAIYTAPDVSASGTPAAPSWTAVGAGAFSASAAPRLSRLAVSGNWVFGAGDGFVRQCSGSGCSWADVPGLPSFNGNPVAVTALATDGVTLYLGTGGLGLQAWTLGSSSPMSDISGSGSLALDSRVVNSVHLLGSQLYVATQAGLAQRQDSATTAAAASGGGGGGGCSMAVAGEHDPVLWLLLLAAAALAIKRRLARQARPGRERA